MRLLLVAALLAATATATAQQTALTPAVLPADVQTKIAAAADQILHDTGVPSASIAIAQNGRIIYAQAFGLANVTPPKPAEPQMAYPIGSISKQFTANAVLLLQQEGKLSIQDPVGKYLPELTRANDVKLINLMTMTSGYEDFAPQDYIIPAWRQPVDPLTNIHEWAEKPLDFEPGTQWQYSNTNYVILGLIVQKVSGEPLAQFIRDRVLDPLHLQGVFNSYSERQELQVTGYVSYAMQPVRVLPLEGTGWYFGDGDLAMPAATLATWDIGIMHQSLLSPASYKQFETPFVLKDGTDSHYGLGTFVYDRNGHRELEHSGEVGGYVAENVVYPDDGIAIVVLTNEVASSAASKIASAITPLLLPAAVTPTPPADTFAPELKTILTAMQTGHIDRSLFTADTNDYFDAAALADFQATLAPLGPIQSVDRLYTHPRGGMTGSVYKATFAKGSVTVSTYLKPDGKIEQFLIVAKS